MAQQPLLPHTPSPPRQPGTGHGMGAGVRDREQGRFVILSRPEGELQGHTEDLRLCPLTWANPRMTFWLSPAGCEVTGIFLGT